MMEYDQQKEQMAQTGIILEKGLGKETLEKIIREQIIKINREYDEKNND